MYLGMKCKGDTKDIGDEYCYSMANMLISKRSQLKMRNGFTKENSTSLGAATRGICGYRIRGSITPLVIAAESTQLQTL